MRSVVRLGFISFILFFVLSSGLQAQTASGTLHGQVTDPSGAMVTQATISTTSATGKIVTTVTNSKGAYEIKDLPPGKYAVRVKAKGFAKYETQDVAIASGAAQVLDIALNIAVEETTVNVEDENTTVGTDSASNSSTVVIKGKDLDALSDDPDELQSDLEALAGPSAGPNGGQIYH